MIFFCSIVLVPIIKIQVKLGTDIRYLIDIIGVQPCHGNSPVLYIMEKFRQRGKVFSPDEKDSNRIEGEITDKEIKISPVQDVFRD